MKAAVFAVLMLAVSAAAQTSYPPPPPARTKATPAPSARPVAAAQPGAPVPNSTVPVDTPQLLAQLDQTSGTLNNSLRNLRIEKWKTDGQSKTQLQSNAESIQRNISSALPGMINVVRTAPDDLAASFKLYRNVSALYDVLASLTEAAGAFGPKEEFRDLSYQLQQMDNLRRGLGDRMEQLATTKDTQINQLRAQVKQYQAAAAAAPPKKVVVDDNEQPKPKKKKKPSASTAQTGTTPPQ